MDHPEYTLPGGTKYIYSGTDFWTSGFSPGCLSALREWQLKFPSFFPSALPHPLKLQHACKWWTHNLHVQAARTDTHDLGFVIQPWTQPEWEIDGGQHCFDSMVTAAKALASRFDASVGAIRSWDTCRARKYDF